MPNSKPYYITFRHQTDQDGTERITVIRDGIHVGGIAEGHLSLAGGLDVQTATALERWAGSAVVTHLFGVSQGTLE